MILRFNNSLQTVTKDNRNLWQWINIIFNRIDEDRRKTFGPDRTCAEWLLRNGAAVKWVGSKEFLSDYNSLPIEGTKLCIKEVDASDSSIMHYGFPHFVGCKCIEKLILHNCKYIENEALAQLKPLNATLTHLQVSQCANISEAGLKSLSSLSNLRKLVLFGFPYVTNKDGVVEHLTKSLPQCNVSYE